MKDDLLSVRCKSIIIVITLISICVIILSLYKLLYTIDKFDNENKVKHSVIPDIQKIYYINLEKREDRKKQFLSNFTLEDQFIIERISAVYTERNGSIGCLMSHIKALKEFLKSNAEVCIICEDDLEIFNIEQMNRCVSEVLRVFPNWDVIMIAHNSFNLEDTKVFIDNIEIKRVKDSQTASGYIINRKYAPKLLKVYEESMKAYEKTGIFEYWMCSDQCWKSLQREGNWYTFIPRLGRQRASYSDILKVNVNYECFNGL